MKLAIFGATGLTGGLVLTKALEQGRPWHRPVGHCGVDCSLSSSTGQLVRVGPLGPEHQ